MSCFDSSDNKNQFSHLRFLTDLFCFGTELVYCGSVLDDAVELSKEGIKSGSTIHVFDKNVRQEGESTAFTEEEVADASKAYRSVCFSSRPNNLFPVSSEEFLGDRFC